MWVHDVSRISEAHDAEHAERQNDYDDLLSLLDDNLNAGRAADVLLKAVEQLVEHHEGKK